MSFRFVWFVAGICLALFGPFGGAWAQSGKVVVGQETPGSVFLVGEPVRIPVETPGDSVSWTVKDFWGATVARGTTSVAGGRAVIVPGVKSIGYFEIALSAASGGAVIARGDATFAIVTPFDLSKVTDSPFGLMTHFAQDWDVDLLPVIARSGAKNIRDELYWGQVEKTPGEFVFREQFENYMAAAKARHIDPLIVLSFANSNYDSGNTPHTPAGYAAYARYATEVLKKYGGQIKYVEVWNEYNGSFAKGPATEDRPRHYTEMLKAAYAAIKRDRPDVTVVGVSAVNVPFPYLDQVFQNGALSYMDALSVHPYRTSSAPEGLERQMERLRDFTAKRNGGKRMPIWITEIGWYVKAPDPSTDLVITEADQARYLVRSYALSLSAGVEKIYWYLTRDDASFPTMGIVRSPEDPKGRYAPKPAYVALATLTRRLTGARFDRREPTVSGDVYSLLFRRGAEPVRVMWSLTPVTLAVKAGGPLTVVDMIGVEKTLPPTGGVVRLPLNDAPVYVTGDVRGLPPVDLEPGKVIAEAEEEFSNVQGADNWHYGYFVAPAPGAPYVAAEWKPLPAYRATPWNYEWAGEQPYLTITPAGQHPSAAGGKPVWAVRRWVGEVTGNIRIQGKFSRTDQGDGVNVRVFVAGKEVWKRLVGGGQPSSVRLDVTVPVKVGEPVDFAVDPGPSADNAYDGTSVSVTIRHMPTEPK